MLGELAPCPYGHGEQRVTDEHVEEVGPRARPREVLVVDLACGHSIDRPALPTGR